MISKEKSTAVPTDKFGLAGYEAEQQMAFYLRRAFADSQDICVFNDLRIEWNGEFAQIDHLVFHRFGFVIVESKSIASELSVNHRGEFARTWNRQRTGIPSPIQQAKLQADLLGKLLNHHKEQLRQKTLFGFQQPYFGEERFRILVAISDRGVIEREKCDPPELCKADSVADRIREIIERHREASSVTGFVSSLVATGERFKQYEKDLLRPLNKEEMAGIQAFLLTRHTPLFKKQEVIAEAIPLTPPIAEPAIIEAQLVPDSQCRHCNSRSVTASHGRYGYYLKCNQCQGNTSIDHKCQKCKAKARIQKTGLQFNRVCEACGTQALVHENLPSK